MQGELSVVVDYGVSCVASALEAYDYIRFFCKQIEGYDTANWVLMDFGDVIVHIFDKENRLLFDLERIWRDGKISSADALLKEE